METYPTRSFDLQKQWESSVFEHGCALRLTCPSYTYARASMEFTATRSCSPRPFPCWPLFSYKKNPPKETRLQGNVFDETADGWWKERMHGGKQAAEGALMGSYTGSLYRFGANRWSLSTLECWLALLIEQVIFVIGWLHIISEVLAARSYWDISLIANFECAHDEIKITPAGRKYI